MPGGAGGWARARAAFTTDPTPERTGEHRLPPAGGSGVCRGLRIGLVTHYMPPHHGGIERVAETLFVGYEKSGLDVRWVASRVPPSTPDVEGNRIRVPCWNWPERALGVPVPLWGVRAWRQLDKLARWADVLHVHDCLYPGTAVATLLARQRNKPVLLSQHIGFTRYRFPPLNWLEHMAYATLGRAILRRVSHVVLVTPRAATHVTRLLGGPLPNSCVIPNGIDVARFRPATAAEQLASRARFRFSPDDKIVLFAGRLVRNKGVDIVIEVSRLLGHVKFLIIGDGPLAPLLAHRADNVVWFPSVRAELMPECYHAVDCLLLPSVDEGSPLVVQEAMASGLPVVVSAEELYAEPLVAHNVCVTAARTARSMAGRVDEILVSRGSPLGARARAYAVAQWSAETMTARYVSLLHDLAATATRHG